MISLTLAVVLRRLSLPLNLGFGVEYDAMRLKFAQFEVGQNLSGGVYRVAHLKPPILNAYNFAIIDQMSMKITH